MNCPDRLGNLEEINELKFKVQSSKFITGFRVADLGLGIEHPTSAVLFLA